VDLWELEAEDKGVPGGFVAGKLPRSAVLGCFCRGTSGTWEPFVRRERGDEESELPPCSPGALPAVKLGVLAWAGTFKTCDRAKGVPPRACGVYLKQPAFALRRSRGWVNRALHTQRRAASRLVPSSLLEVQRGRSARRSTWARR